MDMDRDQALALWLGVARETFEEWGPHAFEIWQAIPVAERQHQSLWDNRIAALQGDAQARAVMKKFITTCVTRRLQ